jgi:alpha-ketoglutarate-dependent 2,4-dichlorophenoxyacetate dioxygenase
MAEYAVLVFRDQPLTDEEQLRFTLHFGELEETRGGTPGHIHFRTDREVRKLGPGIKDFSNVGPAGEPLSTDSRAYAFKLADQLWHSDSSFNAIPAFYSLLSGRSVVSWGGNTEFADMRAAYDALDDRTKAEIEDLVCRHSNQFRTEFAADSLLEGTGFEPSVPRGKCPTLRVSAVLSAGIRSPCKSQRSGP